MQRAKASGHAATSKVLPCLLIIVDYCGVRHQLAHHVTSLSRPPCQFLETFKTFLPGKQNSGKDKETSHHQEVFKLTFSLQDAEAALETADYINLAPGQTWAGEISII